MRLLSAAIVLSLSCLVGCGDDTDESSTPASCRAVQACVAACADDSCRAACSEGAPADVSERSSAVDSCIEMNCPERQRSCIDRACWEPLFACLDTEDPDLLWGTGTCREKVSCQTTCHELRQSGELNEEDDDFSRCLDYCSRQTAQRESLKEVDVFTCGYEHGCRSPLSDVDYETCIAENCPDVWAQCQ